MATLGFPFAALIQRLEGVAELKQVGVAIDLQAALEKAPRACPAVYVLSQTTGGPFKFSGPPAQQGRTTTIKLIVWVRHHGQPAQVQAQMDGVLAAIDARLSGWIPGNAFSALRFTASRDEFGHNGHQVVQMQFAGEWNFSSEVQA